MKAVSTHSIDQIRLHVPYEAIRTRLPASFRSLSKKTSESTEKIATVTAIILISSLLTTAFMKLGEYCVMNSQYCEIISKMVFVP